MIITDEQGTSDFLTDLGGAFTGAISSIGSQVGTVIGGYFTTQNQKTLAETQLKADTSLLAIQREIAEIKSQENIASLETQQKLAQLEADKRKLTLQYVLVGTGVVLTVGLVGFFIWKAVTKK